VDDPPPSRVLADDHAEVHGEGVAVAETEVDREVPGIAPMTDAGKSHGQRGVEVEDFSQPEGNDT
jgi:hypothetical protein